MNNKAHGSSPIASETGVQVLVIEDDKDAADALSQVLTLRGFDVRSAYNADDARRTVEEFEPAIALVDIRLGHDDGIALIGELKQKRPLLFCITMTAYADLDIAVEALRQGAYDFLQKPISLDLLEASLNRCRENLCLQAAKEKAEIALKFSEARLRQAEKLEAVGQLTGGIAHNLNNLLGVAIGNLDFLEEELEGDASKLSLLSAALKAAINCASLNRKLLAFSRQQSLSPRKIDLNVVIAEILESLDQDRAPVIEIDLRRRERLWAASVDPLQVARVIRDLTENSLNAMPVGGKMTIETANVTIDGDITETVEGTEPGEYVMLSVTDTGVGMTPEALKRAFEPFFTTREVGQGEGLGLSMAYGFAKQSGGDISIESVVGHGTTVNLYLPRACL